MNLCGLPIRENLPRKYAGIKRPVSEVVPIRVNRYIFSARSAEKFF